MLQVAVARLEAAEMEAGKARNFMNPLNYTWVQALSGKKWALAIRKKCFQDF